MQSLVQSFSCQAIIGDPNMQVPVVPAVEAAVTTEASAPLEAAVPPVPEY